MNKSAQGPTSPPMALHDQWIVGDFAEHGLDASKMAELRDNLRTGKLEFSHVVLIEKEGRLIYEIYLIGKDERWGTPLDEVAFSPNTFHDLFSVTESVTSLLLGIALQESNQGPFEEALSRPLPTFFLRRADDLDPALF